MCTRPTSPRKPNANWSPINATPTNRIWKESAALATRVRIVIWSATKRRTSRLHNMCPKLIRRKWCRPSTTSSPRRQRHGAVSIHWILLDTIRLDTVGYYSDTIQHTVASDVIRSLEWLPSAVSRKFQPEICRQTSDLAERFSPGDSLPETLSERYLCTSYPSSCPSSIVWVVWAFDRLHRNNC